MNTLQSTIQNTLEIQNKTWQPAEIQQVPTAEKQKRYKLDMKMSELNGYMQSHSKSVRKHQTKTPLEMPIMRIRTLKSDEFSCYLAIKDSHIKKLMAEGLIKFNGHNKEMTNSYYSISKSPSTLVGITKGIDPTNPTGEVYGLYVLIDTRIKLNTALARNIGKSVNSLSAYSVFKDLNFNSDSSKGVNSSKNDRYRVRANIKDDWKKEYGFPVTNNKKDVVSIERLINYIGTGNLSGRTSNAPLDE